MTQLTHAIGVVRSGVANGLGPLAPVQHLQEAAHLGAVELLLGPLLHLVRIEVVGVDLLRQAGAIVLVAAEAGEQPLLGAGRRRFAVGAERLAHRPGHPSPREAGGNELLGGLQPLRQQIEELVELLGDGADHRRVLAMALGEPIEPGQHRHGEAVVVAVALGDQLAVAVDAVDHAVPGARHDVVADRAAGDQLGRVPGERERAPRRAAAAGISGLAGDAGGAAGVGDDAGVGERAQEKLLDRRR